MSTPGGPGRSSRPDHREDIHERPSDRLYRPSYEMSREYRRDFPAPQGREDHRHSPSPHRATNRSSDRHVDQSYTQRRSFGQTRSSSSMERPPFSSRNSSQDPGLSSKAAEASQITDPRLQKRLPTAASQSGKSPTQTNDNRSPSSPNPSVQSTQTTSSRPNKEHEVIKNSSPKEVEELQRLFVQFGECTSQIMALEQEQSKTSRKSRQLALRDQHQSNLLKAFPAMQNQHSYDSICTATQLAEIDKKLQDHIRLRTGLAKEMANSTLALVKSSQSAREDTTQLLDLQSKELADLRNEVRSQAKELAYVKTMLKTTQRQSDSCQSRYDNLSSTISGLEGELRSATCSLEDRLGDAVKKLEGADDLQSNRLAAVEIQLYPLRDMNSSLTDLKSQMSDLVENTSKYVLEKDSLKLEEFSRLKSVLTRVSEQLKTARPNEEASKEPEGSIRQSAVATQLFSQDPEVHVPGRINLLFSELKSLRSEFSHFQNSLADVPNLRADVNKLSKALNEDGMPKLLRHSKKIKSIEAELAGNTQGLQQLSEHVDTLKPTQVVQTQSGDRRTRGPAAGWQIQSVPPTTTFAPTPRDLQTTDQSNNQAFSSRLDVLAESIARVEQQLIHSIQSLDSRFSNLSTSQILQAITRQIGETYPNLASVHADLSLLRGSDGLIAVVENLKGRQQLQEANITENKQKLNLLEEQIRSNDNRDMILVSSLRHEHEKSRTDQIEHSKTVTEKIEKFAAELHKLEHSNHLRDARSSEVTRPVESEAVKLKRLEEAYSLWESAAQSRSARSVRRQAGMTPVNGASLHIGESQDAINDEDAGDAADIVRESQLQSFKPLTGRISSTRQRDDENSSEDSDHPLSPQKRRFDASRSSRSPSIQGTPKRRRGKDYLWERSGI